MQAWLKIEHQPRFYHWILLTQWERGTWRGSDLLDYYNKQEATFPQIRSQYLEWIKGSRPELTPNQIGAHGAQESDPKSRPALGPLFRERGHCMGVTLYRTDGFGLVKSIGN